MADITLGVVTYSILHVDMTDGSLITGKTLSLKSGAATINLTESASAGLYNITYPCTEDNGLYDLWDDVAVAKVTWLGNNQQYYFVHKDNLPQ